MLEINIFEGIFNCIIFLRFFLQVHAIPRLTNARLFICNISNFKFCLQSSCSYSFMGFNMHNILTPVKFIIQLALNVTPNIFMIVFNKFLSSFINLGFVFVHLAECFHDDIRRWGQFQNCQNYFPSLASINQSKQYHSFIAMSLIVPSLELIGELMLPINICINIHKKRKLCHVNNDKGRFARC